MHVRICSVVQRNVCFEIRLDDKHKQTTNRSRTLIENNLQCHHLMLHCSSSVFPLVHRNANIDHEVQKEYLWLLSLKLTWPQLCYASLPFLISHCRFLENNCTLNINFDNELGILKGTICLIINYDYLHRFFHYAPTLIDTGKLVREQLLQLGVNHILE